jgi:hypothetical protein
VPPHISAIGGLLRGYAADESGVAHIVAEFTAPSGALSTVQCPAPESLAGLWTCRWDATAANGGVPPPDGAQFGVRLQAADRYGQLSEWSAPATVRVDAQPPTLSVSAAAVAPQLRLSGVVSDTAGVEDVVVCVDDVCRPAGLAPLGAGTQAWSLSLPDQAPNDYVLRTVTVTATDRLGNRVAQPWQAQLALDNVAPRIEATPALAQLTLGARDIVLRGRAVDGGPVVETTAIVRTPGGELRQQPVETAAGEWSVSLLGEQPGLYFVSVEARDLAGNVSAAGPFPVDVTCLDASLVVSKVMVAPTDGLTLTLVISATVTNTGPQPMPAGIPVGLYDETGRLSAFTTAVGLGAGASEILAFKPWTVPQPGRYDLYVVPGDPELGQVLPVTLCQAPNTLRAALWAGPQPEPRKLYLPVLMRQTGAAEGLGVEGQSDAGEAPETQP